MRERGINSDSSAQFRLISSISWHAQTRFSRTCETHADGPVRGRTDVMGYEIEESTRVQAVLQAVRVLRRVRRGDVSRIASPPSSFLRRVGVSALRDAGPSFFCRLMALDVRHDQVNAGRHAIGSMNAKVIIHWSFCIRSSNRPRMCGIPSHPRRPSVPGAGPTRGGARGGLRLRGSCRCPCASA